MSWAAIGSVVEAVRTWNPRSSAGQVITYLDLSSVDNQAKAVVEPSRVDAAEAPSRARQLVSTGDVIVSTVRPNLNAVAAVPPEMDGATASTGFCVLRPKRERVDGRYLLHWVRGPIFVEEMVRLATGASYPAVSDRIIKDSQIPLPPIEEQRRIAAVLDVADALRAKRRQALAKLDTVTQAIFTDMFGQPGTNSHRFETAPLIEIVDSKRPITYGILKPGKDLSDGVPYVRVVDMVDGSIDAATLRRTTPEISHQFRRSLLQEGDVLMSIRGHVGRLAMVEADAAGANITQDTARLAIAGANPVYLLECLRSDSIQYWMSTFTKGAAVRGINLTDVKRLPIPLPPRHAQDNFADVATRAKEQRRAHRGFGGHADALFASLQQRAFRGEL